MERGGPDVAAPVLGLLFLRYAEKRETLRMAKLSVALVPNDAELVLILKHMGTPRR